MATPEVQKVQRFLDKVTAPTVYIMAHGKSVPVPANTLRDMVNAQAQAQVQTIPYARGSATSKAAAQQGAQRAAACRTEVLAWAKTRGKQGLTADEADQHFGWGHQTTSARVSEMASKYNTLVRTNTKRKTRRGCSAYVYVAPEFA
jgi:hypothetical protein